MHCDAVARGASTTLIRLQILGWNSKQGLPDPLYTPLTVLELVMSLTSAVGAP